MELSRSEYPAMLATLQPTQAVSVLSDRVKYVDKVNIGIADWLQERRRLEEEYARGLRQLAKRQLEDSSELGVFSAPWQKILESATELADSHMNLAAKIQSDVEKPLRTFASANREMQSMPNIQGNLASLAREFESAQKKAGKAKEKGAKASSNMESASSQWESQAPFVFEQLQALDESRCNHLRDVLTQYQTHEVDQVERSRVAAERALNSLLSIETADEIKIFSMRQSDARGQRTSERRERRASVSLQNAAQPSSSLAPPPSSHSRDEGESQSGSIQEEKKGGFRGLKRLGTVMGRRRQSTAKGERLGEKPGKTSHDLSRSPIPEPVPKPPPFLPPPTLSESSPPASPTRSTQLEREIFNISNGQGAARNTDRLPVNGNAPRDVTRLQNPLQPSPRVVQTSFPGPAPDISTEGGREQNGLSSGNTDLDPITRAQQEAASVSETNSPALKVDIQNAPITEDGTDNATAMADMANTLRAQAVQPRRTSTLRGRRDMRSAVFVPSTSPTLENEFPVTAVQPQAQPTFPEPPVITPLMSSLHSTNQTLPFQSRPLASEEPTGSDSQSIRSLGSLGSIATLRHPDMRQPGMNSSIIETVSAWFENGNVSRAVVIGELALAHNPGAFPNANISETIRLDNFQELEKVAPNPSFVKPVSDKSGEYVVDLASIVKTQVAFKYQLHLSESTVSKHAPVIISPAWKNEPTQTSVILSYSLNPLFGSTLVTLTNVVFSIHLAQNLTGAGKPSSCQSKPSGTFSKEKGLIYWKMDEIQLSASTSPQRLLARFATDGEAKPGKIEARWEIDGARANTLGSGLAVRVQQAPAAGADPFADEGGDIGNMKAWKPVQGVKKMCSGTYVAQ